ncbi:malonate--CoA ligase ACSF3, mitochondrial [Zerene cesonia]|uniref:malonate--CoA ligase ACSF3, mitochondrial n=1 Tax=Zerene cesonia TaxID=33412 RepID=UPI0018E586BE|nr:malonate--CoA ligase ACSF3, mitochondrial [Zerene cesonia]
MAMELTTRFRSFHRLFQKPLGIVSYQRCSHTVPKENPNPDLLNSFNQDIKAGGVVPVFRRALLFPSRVAVQDEQGSYTYAGLYQAANELSQDIAAQLLGEKERTISYMCGNNASHIIVQWAIWMTGNIAVPLTPIHPPDMLKYFISDSDSSLIICTQEHEDLLRPIVQEFSKPLLVSNRVKNDKEDIPDSWKPEAGLSEAGPNNRWYGGKDAMLIYTSGTTSKPKGVVWTHSMLSTQIAALHTAWQYSAHDVVLHTLPLHHIHGQLNSLNASLAAGAKVRMLASFASHAVWAQLVGAAEARVSVFHGVPAMYARLAADHANMFTDDKTKEYVRSTLSKMRLMCAGSAPLPETLFNKWEEISGIRLLERYGMSEVGMALSNPYRPAGARAVGRVGAPLPGVAARIALAAGARLEPLLTVDCDVPDTQINLDRLGFTKNTPEENNWKPAKVTVHKESENGVYEGELLLKGPNVFTRYWNRAPSLTSSDFTEDGWFRTGDIASYSEGSFRIMGRSSVDIIKTSGYKVSALQVESAILEHPNIADAAVLGIEDENYGEIIASVVVTKDKKEITLKELREVAGKKLAPYQLPRTLLVVETMPRNVMGKLDKKEIKRLFGKQLVYKKS